MTKFSNILKQINVKYLITVFNIQIAIAIFLVFLIFRRLFAQIILKVLFKIIKKDKKVKETHSYKIMSRFFIFLGTYLALRMLELSLQARALIDTIFQIICTLFITGIITLNINKDAVFFTKYVKHSKSDVVNNFICKIINGIIWIIAIYICLLQAGWNLTGLIAGFGVRQCYYFFGCTRYGKRIFKWRNSYDR